MHHASPQQCQPHRQLPPGPKVSAEISQVNTDGLAVMARSQLSLAADQRGCLTCRVVMCLSLNLFSQQRRTSDVFPTQPSPNNTALNEQVFPLAAAAAIAGRLFQKSPGNDQNKLRSSVLLMLTNRVGTDVLRSSHQLPTVAKQLESRRNRLDSISEADWHRC